MKYVARVIAVLLMIWGGGLTGVFLWASQDAEVKRTLRSNPDINIQMYTSGSAAGLLFASGCILWVLADIAYGRRSKDSLAA